MRIERLAQEENVSIRWVHFPLHPETPAEGRSLEDLFAGRGMDIPKMLAAMRARMQAEGLPYGDRTMTFNSRLAQELASWAETQPGGKAIHNALFRAYFVDAKNVGDVNTLVDIAKSIDLSEVAARDVLETRAYSETVNADWRKSRQYGITGVPTFVAGHHQVSGAQPYEVLQQLVQLARAQH